MAMFLARHPVVFIFSTYLFCSCIRHVDGFNTRNSVLTVNCHKGGYRYHKRRKACSKFYLRHFDLVSRYKSD